MLLSSNGKLVNAIVPTETFVLDKSRLGEGKLSDGEAYNNIDDALIAEVTLINGYILLTADYHLYEVAQLHDIGVYYWGTTPLARE